MPTTRGHALMIARPSILYLYATLAALVIVVVIALTPYREGRSGLDFWWARIAPASQARHQLQTTRVFYTSYDGRACPEFEDNIQAWHRLIETQPPSSELTGLAARATPAGQLYVLTALFHIDSAAAIDLLAQVQRDSTTTVSIFTWGHVGLDTSRLREAATTDSIARWARELLDPRPRSHAWCTGK